MPAHSLIHEPAVHFVVVGALIFVAHAALAPPAAPEPVPPGIIEVDDARTDELAEAWQQRNQRTPTAAEREMLVQDWIRDEALFREALRLGLERTDPRVRERLVQLMALVIDEGGDAPPTREALEAWMRENDALYREPARVSVEHRPATEGPSEPVEALDDLSRTRLATTLGQPAAELAFSAALDTWVGPVDTALGPRLLRVTERSPGGLPPLDDVLDRVSADLLEDARQQRLDEAVDALLERRYEVRRLDAPRSPR